MLSLLQKIRLLLTRREKTFCIFLVAMMAVSTFMELLGIGLVMPVIALLSKPQLIQQNKYLRMIHDIMQPSSENNFIVMLCVALIILFLAKNLFMMIMTRIQTKFTFNIGTRMANKLFFNYLNVPYAFHLGRNSSGLLHNIYLILAATQGILMPLMMLTTELLVLFAIFSALVLFAPMIVIPLIVVTVPLAYVTYAVLKKKNYDVGERLATAGKDVNLMVMQGLGCIKECKVRNSEVYFHEGASRHLSERNNALSLQAFISQIPRFVIEGIIVSAGLGVLIILVTSGEAMGSVVLKLSLFAVSLVRVMPSMTRIQYSLSQIKQQHYSFDEVYKDLTELELEDKVCGDARLEFNNHILLENISFSYKGTSDEVFKDFSLTVKKNESVALIGTTGCGKTTLVDILLGLLKPTRGRVLVDGMNVEENLESWQKKIGYVPQFIYLLDASIRENIAYGIPESEIDDGRIRECLEIAQVMDFVDNLPEKEMTTVGENGVRLSGGQRQRLGIARALYHDPEILILDEATSALDNETEKAFVDALRILHGKLTIVMVAHRLTTVENCDQIIDFSKIDH